MYTAEHLHAILILRPHFENTRVAILSSKLHCSLTFATNLLKEFQKENKTLPVERRMNVSFLSFSEDPFDISRVSSILYDIKFLNPTVIVLICAGSVQTTVLKVTHPSSCSNFFLKCSLKVLRYKFPFLKLFFSLTENVQVYQGCF